MYTDLLSKRMARFFAGCSAVISLVCFCNAQKVIQVDVSKLLNARCVTTLTNGNLVTWTKGVDKENGFLTMQAATLKGDKEPHALPDNSLFPATRSHPEILLHYSNDNGTSNQARCLEDSGEFTVTIPAHRYSDLYFSLTSSYGASSLTFEFTYEDGIALRKFIVPDWFKDIPENDPDFTYVAHNMGKWGSTNNLKEADHHNIDALDLHPDPVRILKAVTLKKSAGGYLLFWAATGVLKD